MTTDRTKVFKDYGILKVTIPVPFVERMAIREGDLVERREYRQDGKNAAIVILANAAPVEHVRAVYDSVYHRQARRRWH